MIYSLPVARSAVPPEQQTVLVVDDEPPILMLVQDVLEEEGYTVLTASCAEDGLSIAQTEPVALVLTDLMMPKMDGVAFSSQLRHHPHTANVPIVLMTAAMPAHVDVRFDGFVTKPFAIDQLVSVIESQLSLPGQAAAA